MFIQNVSMEAIKTGNHFGAGDRAILIQIVDPGYIFPFPKHLFDDVYQFEFLDLENDETNEGLREFLITDDQAKEIVRILQLALEETRNVIVHCHAGMCRSGAVVEVGIMMGFEDTKVFRLPNALVKRKLMEVLGWVYDRNADFELPMTDSGIIIASMSDYGG